MPPVSWGERGARGAAQRPGVFGRQQYIYTYIYIYGSPRPEIIHFMYDLEGVATASSRPWIRLIQTFPYIPDRTGPESCENNKLSRESRSRNLWETLCSPQIPKIPDLAGQESMENQAFSRDS